MEGETSGYFSDLMRKNWTAVPSVPKSLEWRTSSRVDDGMEERSADGLMTPSLAAGEWQAKYEANKMKAGGDNISKACKNSEVTAFEKV